MALLVKTIVVLFTFFFIFSPNVAFSEEASSSPKSTFEAFWPLTAGRTADDPLYYLKVWKENLRGVLIFGNPQKAEYAVLMGTKRVLEADKLLQGGKKDLADKTLGKASEQFDIAKKNLNDAKVNKRPLGSSVNTIKPRLENSVILMQTMQSNTVGGVLQKIKELQMTL